MICDERKWEVGSVDCGHIFLIGFMGAGKSTVAMTLKKNYGMEYVEMDRQIENDAGMTVSEIFEKKGEKEFRRMETELIGTFSNRKNLVVSCGGGVPMNPENVKLMKSMGTVVYLSASPETIFERVRHKHHRPLLEGNMNVEYIRKLLTERLPAYESAADITVHTDDKSISEIAAEVRETCLLS